MNTTFGGTIKLDGEKEYREALSQISKELKVAGSEMKIVTAEFGKNNNSVEALTAKNKVLSAEIEKQEEKVGLLNGAYKESVEKYGENSKQALNYKQQLNNATAQLITMTKEVEENEKAIKEAGNTSTSAAKDVDKLGDELKSAGKEAEESGKKALSLGDIIKANLISDAIKGGINALVNGISAIGTAMAESLSTGAEYADNILTLSTQTGISTENLQKYNAVAELVDVSTETMTKSMAKNIKSMTSASTGTGAMAEAYKKLGVSVTNADGTLRDSETVYWETIDALKGITDETERDAIAMQIMGKSAQELNPLIAQGSKGIKAMGDEAEKMGAVLSKDALNSLGAVDDEMQRFKSITGATSNLMASAFAPTVSTLMSGVNDLGSSFNYLISSVIGGDGEGIEEAISMINESMVGILDNIESLLPDMLGLVSNLTASLVDLIFDSGPIFLEAGETLLQALLQGISENSQMMIDTIVSVVFWLTTTLLQNLPMIIEMGMQVVISLATGIADSLPELIPTIVETVLTIVNVLLDNIDLLIEAAIQIVVALAEGIIGALPELIARLPEIIIKITNTLIQLTPQLISASIRIIAVLAEGLIKAIPDLVSKIPQIIRSIKTAFSQGAGDMKNIGVNFLKGIWQGILDTTSWLYNKIKSIGSVIIGAMEDGLDIHSPSRKARDRVGKMTAKGVGVGYIDELKNVKALIKDATQKVLPENLDMGVNTSVHTSVTNYAAQAIASAVITALRQFKGQVILSDREVGEFVIDTVTREVFT